MPRSRWCAALHAPCHLGLNAMGPIWRSKRIGFLRQTATEMRAAASTCHEKGQCNAPSELQAVPRREGVAPKKMLTSARLRNPVLDRKPNSM
ncbi:hypothetical protein [Variovorax sp. AFSI2.2]|uniref:hypothetical protein n=1 Tax=Variovorax sp. AFSI2.2 TaxID=3384160 RepID=UPI003EB84208